MNRKELVEAVKTSRCGNEEVAACQEAAEEDLSHAINVTITQK
jgi:hypothetical protein